MINMLEAAIASLGLIGYIGLWGAILTTLSWAALVSYMVYHDRKLINAFKEIHDDRDME